MKRWIAGTVTLVVLTGALWLSRGDRPTGGVVLADTPENCVERMFQAAERGDTSVYLDCFTAEERSRLDRELADQTPQAFGKSLQQSVRELKGRAVFAASSDNGAESRITVERVYASRTERQTYRMVREVGGWRIASVESAQPYQPIHAYGTPVYDQ